MEDEIRVAPPNPNPKYCIFKSGFILLLLYYTKYKNKYKNKYTNKKKNIITNLIHPENIHPVGYHNIE